VTEPGSRAAELLVVAPDNTLSSARRWVAARGRAHAVLAPDMLELLASEVISNARRHGPPGGVVAVRVEPRAGADCIRVTVTDESPRPPRVRRPPPTQPGGRGMVLVDRCASAWGVDLHADGAGKAVWFELLTAPEPDGPAGSQAQGTAGRPDDRVLDHDGEIPPVARATTLSLVIGGGAAEIVLRGDVDHDVEARLAGLARAAVETALPIRITCSDLVFVDSTALSVLGHLASSGAERPLLVAPPAQLMTMLEVTGMLPLFEWTSSSGVQSGDGSPEDPATCWTGQDGT
jgi:anti-anti-sigma factor